MAVNQVFKVVNTSQGKFTSWSQHYAGAVDYEIGVMTEPRKLFGSLCAFPSLFWANWFATTFTFHNLPSCAILKCMAETTDEVPRSLLKICPETTIFCSSITPLEVVKDYSK